MKPTTIKNPLNRLRQIDLAAIFGVTDRTIRNWDAEGLPGNGEGRGRVYDWSLVLPWYVARISGSRPGAEPLTDKAREQKANADIAEIEAARLAGRTMDRGEVVATWSAFLGRLRESIRGIPHRAAPRIEPGMILAEVEAIIQKEVDQTLRDVVAELEKQA